MMNNEELYTNPAVLACRRRGIALSAQKRPKAALKQYQRGLALDPGMSDQAKAWLYYAIARSYQQIGNIHSAVSNARLAVQLAPRSSAFRQDLSEYLVRVKDYEGARELLSHLCRHFPERSYLWILLGDTYPFPETDAALGCYWKAVEIDPDYGLVHLKIGYLFARLGKYDVALEKIRLAARLDPHTMDLKRIWVAVLLSAGFPLAALKVFVIGHE